MASKLHLAVLYCHFTFKLGVLLYAVRLLGMEREIGPPLRIMSSRLWGAQTESGGLAHFVDVRLDGKSTKGRDPTGEASAISILAEVVEKITMNRLIPQEAP